MAKTNNMQTNKNIGLKFHPNAPDRKVVDI